MVRSVTDGVGRVVASVALLALGACAPPSASPWRTAAPPPPPEGRVEPVFCYRTLADVACYFERDGAAPGQLVAVYPRPTGDPATATYWRRQAGRRAAPAPAAPPPAPAAGPDRPAEPPSP